MRFLTPFFVLLVTSVSFIAGAANSGVVYQIPAGEYSALLDLYNSTTGNNWPNQSGWLDPNADSWFGVTIGGVQYDTNGNVTVQGNVVGLGLSGNQLSGTIPSSLGNLANLQDLDLSANQLSGSIPSSLGNLASLQYLGLEENQLSGSIPSSLGNLA